jgi:ATP-dependent Clp protease protease subunit
MTDLHRESPLARGGDTLAGMLDESVYNRLLKERIIVLGSEVTDQVANRICAQLLLLAAEDPTRDINLWINSPGGSVYSGMAIYDTMQFISNDVATVAMGMAASMGQLLLCAGTKGKRYALPHARIMMHQPSGGIGGTAADIAIQAEQMLSTAHVPGSGRVPHRTDGRPDRGRLRPRPLVHRRRGEGLRFHRQGDHGRRAGSRGRRHRA